MALEQALASLSLAVVPSENALPTKTLVFKPKTGKTTTPVPVIVFALQHTSTPSGVIANAAGVKEPRLARDELVQEFFSTSAKEFSIANLHKNLAEKVKLLVDKNIIDAPSETLLELATETSKASITAKDANAYLESTGIEIVPVDFANVESKPSASSANKENQSKKETIKKEKEAAKLEDAKLIGITVDKAKDFSSWYSQVVTKADLLDYYDISGCYILKPNSYNIWETIQEYLNERIKKIGVQNAYFPLFVSSKVLEKEKDHVEGFAPEVAWVTRAGTSELEEPVAIRPTSETVMYPYYAKWIRSHRDLPLRLNQWNSVVRWEFKHPQPFLRTREFLWQEGHTAHLTKESASEEVEQILDYYAGVYEELLAVPVVKGRKTENEKFAGGEYTASCEAFVGETGRGVQGATSHSLGTNFSRMFNISVENPEGAEHPRVYASQNSWGLSTRVIGVMIMTHSDNKGLVLPPRVAQNQIVVVPVGITAKSSAEQKNAIAKSVSDIEKALQAVNIRVKVDDRDNYSPGWKFADWELKGVPLRLEFGPKDLANNQAVAVRRDTGSKENVSLAYIEKEIPKILDTIQNDLLKRARKNFDKHRVLVDDWKDFVPTLNAKNVLVSPWCGDGDCEDDIKNSSAKKDNGEDQEVDERAPSMGAKSLCVPYEQPKLKDGQKCIKCDRLAIKYCMFGRSY